MKNNLDSFEFLSCIPGSVGGGIKMNAGCFGREFKDILISVQAIDKLGNATIPSKNIKFEYRKNNLPEDLIFLSASLKEKKSGENKIRTEMEKLKKEKEKINQQELKQVVALLRIQYFRLKKRYEEDIKASVPLDKSFGDACISDKHCNFFVNKGNATFDDMINLINFVKKKVLDKTGIVLEKKLKF